MNAPVIHWFRRDLRLADNPALAAALAGRAPLVAVFVLDDATPGAWAPGGASRWWLHGSLQALAADIDSLGGRLVLRRGESVAALTRLVDETGAREVHWTRCYEPHARALDEALDAALGERVALHRHGGNLLFEPVAVRTAKDEPFRVFTPFWRACRRLPEPHRPLAAPTRIDFAPPPAAERLEDWWLRPSAPDWAAGLRERWTPGERGAGERLEHFAEARVRDYEGLRDRPGAAGTSQLSPHLHFGELGPRQVWHRLRAAAAGAPGVESFLRELGWREFSHHILHHWPHVTDAPLNERFARFPWRRDARALRAWQRGGTGYPLVDAGMRELWRTGWMHNRVRMVAASFLVKHLLLSWQEGAAWFWDTLVDADLANNSASWQWVAGCGVDAAPYFRVFNPVLQSRKFDAEGAYLRRWLPELARVPAKWIHEPWRAPQAVLDEAGVALGRDYPRPIVDHGAARARALAAFEEVKAGD
ncbi:MAG: deoxyribodipyrimidine photo-lyase [Gammaproteobacteria bacterium]|nr:deoxyribodipyrimidine photo-lyase [Gammaproteobacteria bacterium]